jgi:hypothetical protein
MALFTVKAAKTNNTAPKSANFLSLMITSIRLGLKFKLIQQVTIQKIEFYP